MKNIYTLFTCIVACCFTANLHAQITTTNPSGVLADANGMTFSVPGGSASNPFVQSLYEALAKAQSSTLFVLSTNEGCITEVNGWSSCKSATSFPTAISTRIWKNATNHYRYEAILYSGSSADDAAKAFDAANSNLNNYLSTSYRSQPFVSTGADGSSATYHYSDDMPNDDGDAQLYPIVEITNSTAADGTHLVKIIVREVTKK